MPEAKNSFSDGLVMDLTPENTGATIMTSALNATLVTMNGNEMQLQNDMGNARVETARLPDGYVPIGTCLFGDIIYVVSYNPLKNKSLIGCFPSPERNISTEETDDSTLLLQTSEFQEMIGDEPTGKLKATTISKQFSKKLNPGDKYIVYTTNLDNNFSVLSDYALEKQCRVPKYLKINIVSIDDNNRITYLNDNTKWYTVKQGDKEILPRNYYMIENNSSTSISKDIDSYRTLVSSAYSIFQSNNSGKLALMFELEKIDGFSCTHTVVSTGIEKIKPENEEGYCDTYKCYNIYFNIKWDSSDNNIVPKGFTFTKSNFSNKYQTYKSDYTNYTKEELKRDELSVTEPDWMKISTYYDGTKYYDKKIIEITKCSNTNSENIINDKSSDLIKLYDDSSYSEYINAYPLRYYDTGLYDIGTYYYSYLNSTNGEISYNKPTEIKNGEKEYINSDKFYELNNGKKEIKDEYQIYVPTDDIINNKFNKDVIKFIGSIKIPINRTFDDGTVCNNYISDLIWEYTVAPCMDYGVLEEYSISNKIDFSKINLGFDSIKLTQWRYYNSGSVSNLSWGLEVYEEENSNVKDVTFEFYDNQGIAAAYHINGLNSYSGKFTNYIEFGNTKGYYLNDRDSNNDIFTHSNDGLQVTDDNNDAGTIYPNWLYLVKIIINYGQYDDLGEFMVGTLLTKEFYRWYYTNTLFNESYQTIYDFDSLQPELAINNYVLLDTSKCVQNGYSYKRTGLLDEATSELYTLLQANVMTMNQDCKENVKLTITPVVDSYDVFSLNKNALGLLTFGLEIKDKSITNQDPVYSEEGNYTSNLDSYVDMDKNGLLDSMNVSLSLKNSILDKVESEDDYEELYDSAEACKNYVDSFDLYFFDEENYEKTYTKSGLNYAATIDGISLGLTGVRFNKIMGNKFDNVKVKLFTRMSNSDNFFLHSDGQLYLKYFYLIAIRSYLQAIVGGIQVITDDSKDSILNMYYNYIALDYKAITKDNPCKFDNSTLQQHIQSLSSKAPNLSIIPVGIACNRRGQNTYVVTLPNTIKNGSDNSKYFFSSVLDDDDLKIGSESIRTTDNSGRYTYFSFLVKDSQSELWYLLGDWFITYWYKYGEGDSCSEPTYDTSNIELDYLLVYYEGWYKGKTDYSLDEQEYDINSTWTSDEIGIYENAYNTAWNGYKEYYKCLNNLSKDNYTQTLVKYKKSSSENITLCSLLNSVFYSICGCELGTLNKVVPNNFIKLTTGVLTWNATISINQSEFEYKRLELEEDDFISDDLLTFNGISFSDYVRVVMDQANCDISTNNIDIIITPVQQDLNVQLNINYEISNLVSSFYTNLDRDLGQIDGETYYCDVDDIGVVSGDTIVSLNSANIPYYNKWKEQDGLYIPVDKDDVFGYLGGTKQSNLAKIISYNLIDRLFNFNILKYCSDPEKILTGTSSKNKKAEVECFSYQLLNEK